MGPSSAKNDVEALTGQVAGQYFTSGQSEGVIVECQDLENMYLYRGTCLATV
jgi:hypothetical protein